MRIVWVTLDNPVPPRSGGAMLTTGLATGFASCGATIRLVAAGREHAVPADLGRPYGIAELRITPRRRPARALAALLRHPLWSWSAAQRITGQLRRAIREGPGPADLAILEIASMIPCATDVLASATRRIFLHQNLQSLTQESIADHLHGPARLAWRREAWVNRRLEDRIAADHRFERFIVVNAREADVLAQRYPFRRDDLIVIPMPYVTPPLTRSARERNGIVFVGSLDYPPNQDAAEWFATRVLPLVRRHVHDVRFTIVGRRPSTPLREMAAKAGATVLADPPDVDTILRGAALAVVPVRAGGGAKIKLLDAIAHGAPVVSTTVSLEGTSFVAGTHLLAADTPEQFAAACLEVLAQPDAAARRAADAHALLSAVHAPARVARIMLDSLGMRGGQTAAGN